MGGIKIWWGDYWGDFIPVGGMNNFWPVGGRDSLHPPVESRENPFETTQLAVGAMLSILDLKTSLEICFGCI